LSAAALTVMAAAAAPSQADPQVLLGEQAVACSACPNPDVNNGAIDPYRGATAYGTFYSTSISGLANPGNIPPTPTFPLLQGATLDASTIPGTLVVWMTTRGNLGANLPLGTQGFESSFTQNLLPSGWTVQVDTFLDPADGIFTTAIPLSSHLFTASTQTFDQFVPVDPGNGFYSVTARFTISANDVAGSTNTTADIAIAPVPAPIAGAGLPGLIAACGGLLGWWRRREKTA
jgi:hypothetical protein